MGNRNLAGGKGILYTSSRDDMMSAVVMVVDIILCCLVYVVVLLSQGESMTLWEEQFARASAGVMGLCYTATVLSRGVILNRRDTRKWQVVVLVLKNMLTLAVFGTALLYILQLHVMPVYMLMLFYLLAFIVCACFRLAMHKGFRMWRMMPGHYDKVLLLCGDSDNSDVMREFSKNPQWGYKVVGYFSDSRHRNMESYGCTYLGCPDESLDYLQAHKDIDTVLCSITINENNLVKSVLRYCINNMMRFYSIPDLHNYIPDRVHLNMLGSVPVFGLFGSALSNPWRQLEKRTFDVVFSLLFLCTLFIPILIVVTIITKITMPGPVFFRQKRTGLNGKPFYVYKFRSMKVNDDADRVQATKDDPRKTRWGNFMRHTNIDELPQFINVLLGDMSVVGPRPHMEMQTEMYSEVISKYMMRHVVKPGITGLAQVSGYRGETSELWQMEGRVRFDVWYIENWSMGLDFYVIYKTVANIVSGDKNAY